jgi:BNR repeat-like domain
MMKSSCHDDSSPGSFSFLHRIILTILLLLLAFAPAVHALGIVVMPHNSEWVRATNPCFTRVVNGSLLAAFSNASTDGVRFGGAWGKYSDNGTEWSDKFLIKASTDKYTIVPDALLTLNNKTMLFYVRFVRFDDYAQEASVWLMESSDNGLSWANDRRIDFGRFNYTLGTYQVLKLRNGTLIFPISWLVDFHNSIWSAGFLRSDDGGVSWFQAGTVPKGSGVPISRTGFDEPSCVELRDGSLYCLLRSSGPRHLVTRSYNCGLTWTVPAFVPEMTAVNSTPAIARVNDTLIVAAWINRSASYVPRSPLVLACSFDECITWELRRVVEPNRNVNDMSFYVDDTQVLLGYRYYDESKSMNDDSMVVIFKNFSFLRGDINHDGIVDIYDTIKFGLYYEMVVTIGDSNSDGITDVYDAVRFSLNNTVAGAACDFNGDGIVDMYDAIILATQFGRGI